MSIDGRSDIIQLQAEPPMPLTADYIQLILLIILFVIGAPINLVSFTKLWRRKALRSASRLAILKLHLNIADLMILFIYVTSTACWQITFQWRGGDFLCKCIKFLHSMSFQLSSNIMVAVALDRLVTIVHCNLAGFRQRKPTRTRRRSTRRSRRSSKRVSDASAIRYVRIFVYTAWIGAIALNLPQFAIWRVHAPFRSRPYWRQCVTLWAIPASRMDSWPVIENRTNGASESHTVISQFTYDILQLIFVFWTPAILLIVSYVIILLYLHSLCLKEQHSIVERRVDHGLQPVAVPSKITLATEEDGGTVKRLSVPYEKVVDEKNADTVRRRSSGNSNTNCNVRKSICSMASSTAHVASDTQTEKDTSKASRDDAEAATIPAQIQLVRRKTFRTSMMLIFAYLLFWLPYNMMALWWFIDTEGYRRHGFSLKFLNVLIVLNSVVNPFIYGTLGKRWLCIK